LAALLTAFLLGSPGAAFGNEATALTPGKALKPALAGGESHQYSFHLRSGEYARVVIEQRSVDVAVTCLAPGGQELFAADSAAIGDGENVELIAEADGEYRLRVAATESHAPVGQYEIELLELRPAIDRERERVAAAREFGAAMKAQKSGTRDGFLQAISHEQQALDHWRAAGDRVEESQSLLKIGLFYIEIADREKALQFTTEALAVARSTSDGKTIGRALEGIGRVHNSFGDKRKAIEYCNEALPLLRAAGDGAGEANALENAGVAYSGIGDKRKALDHYEQAAMISRELRDRRMLAELAGNTGVVYDDLGEYQRSLESHAIELALARELGDRPTEAVTLNNIANAYAGLGEYQKTLDTYTAALEINQSLDNQWNVAINLNNIAWTYRQLGDGQRALPFYEKSLDLIRKVNDRRRIATTLNNIASIHTDRGDYAKAIEIHKEALALRRATGNADGEANSLANLATAYARLGQRELARQHYEAALAIHRTSGNRHMLAGTLRNIGIFYRETGDPEQARTYLAEALEITRATRDRYEEAEALSQLAKVERDLGDLACAEKRASEALAAWEAIRQGMMSPSLRASLVASVRDVHELQVETLMRMHARQPDRGFAGAALLATERGRARSLLEMLGESGAEIRRGVDAGLLERERELVRLISAKAELQTRLLSGKHTDGDAKAAASELNSLAAELEQAQSRIRQASPQYAALIRPVPLDVGEIQAKVLDGDTVLLEYALGAGASFLWAVTGSSMESFELPSRSDIEAAARRAYDLLTARNLKPAGETAAARLARVRKADEAYSAAAQGLSRMLLSPVAGRIANKRLLIVAEGMLQYLPFGALPDPETGGPLLLSHEIVTAPSASVVAVLRQETAGRKPADKTLAVLADPVFRADDSRISSYRTSVRSGADPELQDYARLRFSRLEADEITRLSATGGMFKALDFDASRETAMKPELGEYRIVHFATHSLLDNQRPELSGVVLSLVDRSGRPQNGFLRLYDIYNLRLNADLVVLSACQTALGQDIKGEGLIGLTRGFLYAGAPRVLATLWEIDDRVTAEAMKKFYEGMLGRAERPAEALRAAQIALWKSRGLEAPYYWAAFNLEGEWR
jgi:CHAT domain-containing protein